MLLFIEYLRCFSVKKIIQHTHSGANMCMCTRVVYLFVCIHVCVCIWVLVWTYWYAHICVFCRRVRVCRFIWHFNPSSVFLYIIYKAHCAIILLCTLMLYICDRSTPDLNKDDELITKMQKSVIGWLCAHLMSCDAGFRKRPRICRKEYASQIWNQLKKYLLIYRVNDVFVMNVARKLFNDC